MYVLQKLDSRHAHSQIFTCRAICLEMPPHIGKICPTHGAPHARVQSWRMRPTCFSPMHAACAAAAQMHARCAARSARINAYVQCSARPYSAAIMMRTVWRCAFHVPHCMPRALGIAFLNICSDVHDIPAFSMAGAHRMWLQVETGRALISGCEWRWNRVSLVGMSGGKPTRAMCMQSAHA